MALVKSHLAFFLIFLIFLSSCSTFNKKDWEKLEDKNFYFQKFKYSQKGINSQKAFDSIKKFPTNKILKIISNKYNINIDTSEYENYLNDGDISGLAVAGLLNQDYVWNNKIKNKNTIEIEYRIDDKVREQYLQTRYYIFIKTNGKTRAKYLGDLSDKETYLFTIAKLMNYSRVNKDSDDSYINNENNTIVDLTTGIFKNTPLASKTNEPVKVGKNYPDKMKTEIKEYIKMLSPADKRKFRDETIKYLYKIIE